MIKSSLHNLVRVVLKKLASLFLMLIFTFLSLVVLAVSVVLMITLQAPKIVTAYTNTGYRDRNNPPFNIMLRKRSPLGSGGGLYNN